MVGGSVKLSRQIERFSYILCSRVIRLMAMYFNNRDCFCSILKIFKFYSRGGRGRSLPKTEGSPYYLAHFGVSNLLAAFVIETARHFNKGDETKILTMDLSRSTLTFKIMYRRIGISPIFRGSCPPPPHYHLGSN